MFFRIVNPPANCRKNFRFREYFLDREDSDSRNFVISQERKSCAKMRNFREICEIYGLYLSLLLKLTFPGKGGDLDLKNIYERNSCDIIPPTKCTRTVYFGGFLPGIQ